MKILVVDDELDVKVLFEQRFRKEIKSGDEVKIDLQVTKSRNDFSRWSIRHQITKNGNILCAELNVDGAWMNLQQRKLMSPPEKVIEVFEQMPRGADFVWL